MQRAPHKNIADARQLSSEEQVMLTRPAVAHEYFGGRIPSESYNKGNLLNSGIDVKNLKGDRGRSQNVIAPVYMDQSQVQSHSVAEINLKAAFKADVSR